MAKAYTESKIIEYTGTLPITIKANGSTLADYRIYGASSGVGDKTANLWNVSFEQGVYRSTDGEKLNSTNYVRSAAKVTVDANTEYTFSFTTTNPLRVGRLISFIFWNSSDEVISSVSETNSKNATFTTPNGTAEMTVSISLDTQFATVTPEDITYAMLTEGSTAPAEYVPNGYKVDMSVSDGTTSTITPIYIGDESLGEDEYISYGEQKIYRKNPANYFDGYFESGAINQQTGAEMPSGNSIRTEFIELEPSNGYYIKWATGSLYILPFIYDENKNFVRYIGAKSNNPSNFYVGSNEKYLRFYLYNTKTPPKEMMVCKNAGAPYYDPQDPPVSLPALPTVDGVTITDYAGQSAAPSQMYIKYNSFNGWAPCGEYVRRNGVWVPCTEYICRNGVWVPQA